MDVFHVDLDNTLIYSYKHEIGKDKRNVEVYQGREISFLTEKTYRLLLELRRHVCIVPTTTRTVEQYARIDLGIGDVKYALACNGGALLVDGKQDGAWYRQSLKIVEESQGELEKAIRYLEQEKSRTLEVRYIQKLFVFTKCQHPQAAVRHLRERLDPQAACVFHNGEKVYVVPKKLDKGTAAIRFRDYIGAEKIFAAGDSAFDFPMLAQADLAAVPAGCAWAGMPQDGHIHAMPGKELFSEEMLEFMLAHCAK